MCRFLKAAMFFGLDTVTKVPIGGIFPIERISKPLLTWRLRASVEVILRMMVEGVEFVLAEPAAFLVAQRRGDLVLL